jgi:hypothetical protein
MIDILKLKDNECIHVETPEQDLALRTKFNELGLTWASGHSYLDLSRHHEYYKNTVYCPANGTYGYLNYFIDRGYTIHKATDVLEGYESMVNTFLGE